MVYLKEFSVIININEICKAFWLIMILYLKYVWNNKNQ